MGMQAWLLLHPAPAEENPLQRAELPLPQPQRGEVLLRVLACGVCRTDVHIAEGEVKAPAYPLILGHQVVGVVEETGPEVDRALLGQRVGVTWMGGTCGACEFCRKGQENLCPQGQYTGLHRPGGFAQWTVARADFLVPLPAELEAGHAAPLLCAGVIGFRALRLAQAPQTQRLGIFGFGASAHLALQVARYWGAEVYVFTRGEKHRQLAKTLGARWCGLPTEDPGVFLDAAVIFSPAGEQVPLALSRVKPSGRVVCAGIVMSPIPPFPYALLYGERQLLSTANATRQDAHQLLQLAQTIPLRPQVEFFPLERANEALQRVKGAQVQGACVLLPWP